MVPSKRLELLRLSALPPQDSVSTNSTTTAIEYGFCYFGISVDFEDGAPAGAGAEEAGAAGFTSDFVSTPGAMAGVSRCCSTPLDFVGAE
jgi:hypothetical protein